MLLLKLHLPKQFSCKLFLFLVEIQKPLSVWHMSCARTKQQLVYCILKLVMHLMNWLTVQLMVSPVHLWIKPHPEKLSKLSTEDWVKEVRTSTSKSGQYCAVWDTDQVSMVLYYPDWKNCGSEFWVHVPWEEESVQYAGCELSVLSDKQIFILLWGIRMFPYESLFEINFGRQLNYMAYETEVLSYFLS